jgi:competence protein ComEC
MNPQPNTFETPPRPGPQPPSRQPTEPDADGPRPAKTIDLRLAGPAAAVWLTALTLLPTSPAIAYATVATALLAAAACLIRLTFRSLTKPATEPRRTPEHPPQRPAAPTDLDSAGAPPGTSTARPIGVPSISVASTGTFTTRPADALAGGAASTEKPAAHPVGDGSSAAANTTSQPAAIRPDASQPAQSETTASHPATRLPTPTELAERPSTSAEPTSAELATAELTSAEVASAELATAGLTTAGLATARLTAHGPTGARRATSWRGWRGTVRRPRPPGEDDPARTRPPGRRTPAFAGIAALLICVAASALGVGLRLSAVASGPVRALAARGSTARLDAVVTGDPKVIVQTGAIHHRETMIVPARAERADQERVRVPILVLADNPAWKRVLPSLRVRFTARLTTPRRGELLAAVALVRGPPTTLGPPSTPQRVAGTVRARLREATTGLPGDQRAVLPGLVDGDTSLLDPELADAFEKAGLTHLMAVSGENLSLILGAVLALGRLLGLGRRAGPLLAGVAVIGFVIVARPSPSVLRAAVMGAVALVAIVSGRERQGVPALCAAALVLVLIDPELARSYGFALSALATLGILVLAPAWRERLSRRIPRSLAEPLSVSAAAHVACAPVLVLLGAGVSLVAIPANLLAAPAVGPATLLGVFAAIVAPVSVPAAHVIVIPAGLAVGWITGVAHVCARMPYAVIRWPDGLTGVALLLVAVTAAALTLRRPLPRRMAAAALAGIVVTALSLRLFAPPWPPHGWLFVTCDVGQGDGLALFAGRRQAVVVDTGPDPRLMDRCLHDLGVGAVPLLVLTHPHADHIDGLPGVLRGRTVGTIVISPDSDGEERRLLPGRTTQPARVGDVWMVGPLTLTVLGPLNATRIVPDDSGTTVNNTSVVMLARWPGLTVLLCGDVEIEAQRELLAAGVPTAEVLKIPHHGSSHQDPAFLAAVHARVAIASVGADNDYGHPAPSTMAELAHLGEHVYRTDRDGDVAVTHTNAGLAVVTRHP